VYQPHAWLMLRWWPWEETYAGVNPQFWANPLVFSVFGKTTIDCTNLI
jgi:hypothetical protein